MSLKATLVAEQNSSLGMKLGYDDGDDDDVAYILDFHLNRRRCSLMGRNFHFAFHQISMEWMFYVDLNRIEWCDWNLLT